MVGRRQTAFLLGLLVLAALLFVLITVVYPRLRVPPAQATPAAHTPAAAPSLDYELYFTTPSTRGVDGQLAALVDSAKTSIDAAVYDFDLENVATALAGAKRRGVRVRFVTDSDTVANKNPEIRRAFEILRQAEVPIVEDGREPIMHHKFMVVDADWVWTGSWNWTTGDTARLNNNALKLRSRELAANYTAEFEKLFARRFGQSKPKGVPNPRLTIGPLAIENYFAPQDEVGARIVHRVNGALQSIQFLAFSFTDDAIGQAMLARHKAGVKVRGVFETTGSQTRFSEYGRMKEAGLEVYLDGNPYVMHHKVIVLDGKTTIFGSYNFSANADQDNDENILFVDDPGLAGKFLEEVERMVGAAKKP